MTVYIPLVVNHAPKAIGQDGGEYRVTFETGAIGALMVYPTREAAEMAEPGKPVMTMDMIDERGGPDVCDADADARDTLFRARIDAALVRHSAAIRGLE